MSALAQDLVDVALANALVASLLALVAWFLLARGKHRVAHFVCVVALIKLVTPPLVRLPVISSPEPPASTSALQTGSVPSHSGAAAPSVSSEAPPPAARS